MELRVSVKGQKDLTVFFFPAQFGQGFAGTLHWVKLPESRKIGDYLPWMMSLPYRFAYS